MGFFSIKMIFCVCGGGGYEDFVDIFCGHHKIGLYLVVIHFLRRRDTKGSVFERCFPAEDNEWSLLCILGYFLKVKVQNGDIYWGY